MYVSPHITDFGQIDLHTHTLAGSSAEDPEETTEAGGGGGFGVIGLVGIGAIALAGRGDEDQPSAVVPPDEEEEKLAQK